MVEAILNGLSGLVAGFVHLHWSNPIMFVVGGVLLYLGIKKGYEPLLLVPIGFGCILVNVPLADLMGKEGFLRTIYDAGVMTELFPLLIFIGIGAMTDFTPLLQNPMTFMLGAAGQFGIFLTLALALLLGFPQLDAVSVGIIGRVWQPATSLAALNGSFDSGGLRIARHLSRPAGKPGATSGLILCHGFPIGPLDARQSGGTFPELIDRVSSELGWVAMTFTFRGCGTSEGDFSLQGWVDDLRAAIDDDSWELAYQPIIDARKAKIGS